jgi:hypothetical protein
MQCMNAAGTLFMHGEAAALGAAGVPALIVAAGRTFIAYDNVVAQSAIAICSAITRIGPAVLESSVPGLVPYLLMVVKAHNVRVSTPGRVSHLVEARAALDSLVAVCINPVITSRLLTHAAYLAREGGAHAVMAVLRAHVGDFVVVRAAAYLLYGIAVADIGRWEARGFGAELRSVHASMPAGKCKDLIENIPIQIATFLRMGA